MAKKVQPAPAAPASAGTAVALNAYEIYISRDGYAHPLPKNFLNFLRAKAFVDRWDQPFAKGSVCLNVRVLDLEPPATSSGHAIFYGKLIELTCREKLELTDYAQGTDSDLVFPAGKAESQAWEFAIAPAQHVLVMQQKMQSCEQRLKRFFEHHIAEWNTNNPAESIEGIFVQAIPQEQEPSTWMLKNDNLGSFEAVLDARKVDLSTGLLAGLLGGLTDAEKSLKVKIEISAGRGDNLPKLLISQLAGFLSSVEDDAVYKASAKRVVDGRREQRPTHLLNAIVRRTVSLNQGEVLRPKLVEFTIETIETFGTDLQGSP